MQVINATEANAQEKIKLSLKICQSRVSAFLIAVQCGIFAFLCCKAFGCMNMNSALIIYLIFVVFINAYLNAHYNWCISRFDVNGNIVTMYNNSKNRTLEIEVNNLVFETYHKKDSILNNFGNPNYIVSFKLYGKNVSLLIRDDNGSIKKLTDKSNEEQSA